MSLATVRPRPSSVFTTRSSDPSPWPAAIQLRVQQRIAEGATVAEIVQLTQTSLAVVLDHIQKVGPTSIPDVDTSVVVKP